MRYRKILTVLVLAWFGFACDSATKTEAGVEVATPKVRGYVMARWHDEIPKIEPGECPEGFNLTEADYFPEQWAAYGALRASGGDRDEALALLPPDACQDPLVQPDPGFLTLDGPALVHGLDLDGVDSRRADVNGATCAHDDFAGHAGATGIDDQLWRLLGCVRGYRPDELIDRLQESNGSIKEGGYAILLEISGMDDPKNDAEIEVQLISANAPATVDASGGIMQNVSVTVHENARYHNRAARGKIVDGILTTEPVDFRIKTKQQTSDNEFWLRGARIRAEVLEDGRIKGIIGAYWDTANFLSVMNDHHFGPTVHLGRSAAYNRGFMCAGLYHAIPRVADGHPDPETGECTSISTAVHFEAVPAFVIHPRVAMAE